MRIPLPSWPTGFGDDVPAAAGVANIAASLSVLRRGPATGPTAAELAEAIHEL